MRDLIGYLKKILFLSSLSLLFLPFTPINANNNFNVESSFEHTVLETEVSTELTLKILSPIPRVISFYTASIQKPNLNVECFRTSDLSVLKCSTFNRGSVTDILIDLQNSVSREDRPVEVLIKYTEQREASPSLNFLSQVLDTTTTGVTVNYPSSLGKPLWSSDPISNIKAEWGDRLSIYIDRPVHSNTAILFGERVQYRFEINKSFTNSSRDENQTFQIYVPPDTPNQLIIWDELEPLPNSTIKDEDGNYTFKYILPPDSVLDCRITGYIQKLETDISYTAEELFLTQKTGYWSLNNRSEFLRINNYLQRRGLEIDASLDDIKNLDSSKKSLFYKYIYDYTVERLQPAEDTTVGIGEEIRLGANTVVDAPNNASSIDYADFLLTLLRAYNIPTRFIIGYISNISGYSSDGFFHHWVEYYDSEQSSWVIADPFLEDFYSKPLYANPFYDHITIIRRGKSSVAPKLSFFNINDFVVTSDTETTNEPNVAFEATLQVEKHKSTNNYVKVYLHFKNTGNVALNTFQATSSNIEGISSYVDPINNLNSTLVLPGKTGKIQFNIPVEEVESSNLFVTARAGNSHLHEQEIVVQGEIDIETPLYIIILSKILSILFFSTLLFLIYLIIKKYILSKTNG